MNHKLRWCTIVSAVAALVLGTITALPASAQPRDPYRPKKPSNRSVAGRPVTVPAPAPGVEETAAMRGAPAVVWPKPGRGAAVLPGPAIAGRGAARPESEPDAALWKQAGVLPVYFKGKGSVQAELLERNDYPGLLMKVAPTRPVTMEVDYSGFRNAYGGDWASRLQLVNLADGRIMPSQNLSSGRLRASGVTAGTYAVTAAPSGNAGSFAATTLAPSLTWQVGLQSGSFQWSYPVEVPDLPGLGPEISLNYSSNSVDGRMASTNNQPSWLGEGFDTIGGHIDRAYQSCKEDGQPNSAELCWASNNAIVSLPGVAGELVRDDVTGVWRTEDDEGWRAELLTGASNGDDNGEYWRLTSPEGTQYFFGLNRRPGWSAGMAETNSVNAVPVFGDDAGEPCNQATLAASWCQQAWRWNLDYVVDSHGDAMSYLYDRELNYYSRSGIATQYTRSTVLNRIEYGQRADTLFVAPAAGRVVFTVADRCLPNTTCTKANPQNWPDVPWDQDCVGTGCTVAVPTFWTTKRLSGITTQVWHESAYRDVDSWSLSQIYPLPGENSSAGMWLDSITHTGHVGGTLTLPPVRFDGVPMQNRVDAVGDASPMWKFRLSAITTESGGRIAISYAEPDCSPSALPAVDSNTKRCYPGYWYQGGSVDPSLDWFHRHVVSQVAEIDPVGKNPTEVTQYEYLGGAAWAHDDAELTPARLKTWGQSRGFQRVRVKTGDPNAGPQSVTEHLFLRGMDDDLLASGARRDVWVTDSQGGTIEDKAVRRGFTRETTVYRGTDWVKRTISEPLEIRRTATRMRSSGPLDAYLTEERSERTYTRLDDGSAQVSETVYSYDDYGRLTQSNLLGDLARPDDDTCKRVTYTQNLDRWILDLPVRTETVGVRCETTPSYPGDLLADERLEYDPATGDVIRGEEASAPGVYVQTLRNVYDAHGRIVETSDALGRTTRTAFTPTIGGPVTGTAVTNALGHTTTTVLDPLHGLAVAVIDANGRRSDATYDALGRVTAAWEAGRNRAAGQSPSERFTYQLSHTAPPVVRTETLLGTGQYDSEYEIFDGFLRERQTQRSSPAGGRILTDVLYDSHGRIASENAPYADAGPPSGTLIEVLDNEIDSQTRYTYDSADRKTGEAVYSRGSLQWTTTTSYGGNWIAEDPPIGGTATMRIFDALDRLVELRQYTGGAPSGGFDATRYGYDRAGRLTSVTDPAGNVWRYAYDLRGRKVRGEDPDHGVSTFTYDDVDQQVAATDARGVTLTSTYDALGRRTALHQDTTKLAEWTFDAPGGLGMPAETRRFRGNDTYTRAVTGYDSGGRPLGYRVVIPVAETGLDGTYTTTMTYNMVGQVATTVLPQIAGWPAETLVQEYNDYGLPSRLHGLEVYVDQTQYDGLGRVTDVAWGAPGRQIWHNVAYDPVTGRRTSVWAGDEQGNTFTDTHYRYDQVGNILSIADGPIGDTQCFEYDYLRRMTEAWTPGSGDCAAPRSASALGGPAPYWNSYTFDKAGNRLSQVQRTSTDSTTFAYTYPAATAAQPHTVRSVAVQGPGGSRTDSYGYDSIGNTTARPGQTLTWDAEGRLASTSTGTSYLYDADGDRLIRRDSTGATLYLGDVEVRKASGSETVQVVRDYGPAVRTEGGLFWQIGDHQGTSMLSVKSDDLTVTRRHQDPYGQARGAASTWPSESGFVGGKVDASAGLVHLGAREYDPALGRFVSVDPIIDAADPQQMQGYSYADGNPITFSDPDGLLTKKKTTTKATTKKKTTSTKKTTAKTSSSKKSKSKGKSGPAGKSGGKKSSGNPPPRRDLCKGMSKAQCDKFWKDTWANNEKNGSNPQARKFIKDNKLSCDYGQKIAVCYGKSWYGNGKNVTRGNYFFWAGSRDSLNKVSQGRSTLLEHEAVHAAQWARHDTIASFERAYAKQATKSWILTGTGDCKNAYEVEAGLAEGGYDCGYFY